MNDETRVRQFTHSVLAQIRAIGDIATRSDAELNNTERALIEGALNEAAERLRFVRSTRMALDRAVTKVEARLRNDSQNNGSQREPLFWEDIDDGGAA
jgi:hypothetical protein